MTEKMLDTTNRCDPNRLADVLRSLGLGDLLEGQTIQHLRKKNPDVAGSNPYNLSTVDCIDLPDHAKASRILRVTVRAGGLTGEFTEKAGFGTTPTTTTAAVTPNGDIGFIATDAITDADITYISERGDVVELFLPIVAATGVMTIPPAYVTAGVILLMEAEVLEGTIAGKKTVLVPGGTAPATLTARLAVNKATINFNAATDVPTRGRVKLLVSPAKDLQNVLEAAASF